jgi:hypothetical protein
LFFLLISLYIYACHSQWNLSPTYQLTKSNIIDICHHGSNTERNNYLWSFSPGFFFNFIWKFCIRKKLDYTINRYNRFTDNSNFFDKDTQLFLSKSNIMIDQFVFFTFNFYYQEYVCKEDEKVLLHILTWWFILNLFFLLSV